MNGVQAQRFPVGCQVRILWKASNVHGRIGTVVQHSRDTPGIGVKVLVEHDGGQTEFVRADSLELYVDREALRAILAELACS